MLQIIFTIRLKPYQMWFINLINSYHFLCRSIRKAKILSVAIWVVATLMSIVPSYFRGLEKLGNLNGMKTSNLIQKGNLFYKI